MKGNIGAEIRQKREEMGVSISWLSRKIGVSPTTISKIESGDYKSKTDRFTAFICHELGIDQDYLSESTIKYAKSIRDRRIAAGLSQKDLEIKSGVSVTVISRIERGMNTTASTTDKLEKALTELEGGETFDSVSRDELIALIDERINLALSARQIQSESVYHCA